MGAGNALPGAQHDLIPYGRRDHDHAGAARACRLRSDTPSGIAQDQRRRARRRGRGDRSAADRRTVRPGEPPYVQRRSNFPRRASPRCAATMSAASSATGVAWTGIGKRRKMARSPAERRKNSETGAGRRAAGDLSLRDEGKIQRAGPQPHRRDPRPGRRRAMSSRRPERTAPLPSRPPAPKFGGVESVRTDKFPQKLGVGGELAGGAPLGRIFAERTREGKRPPAQQSGSPR